MIVDSANNQLILRVIGRPSNGDQPTHFAICRAKSLSRNGGIRGASAGGPLGGREQTSDCRGASKVLIDYGVSLVLLPVMMPLIALTMILVRLTSAGPAIYSQTRSGRNGRPFLIYKLRTMRHDCERMTGPRWAAKNDPRVTLVGRVLRKTHLDELPQIWNVLRGEMSLVGPRPERPEIVNQLVLAVPQYCDREVVLPGVTGLAQVQLPPDSDIEGVSRKLDCDLYYVKNAGLWLDLRIMASTAMKVVGVPCKASCSWLEIPSGVTTQGGSVSRASRRMDWSKLLPD